MTMRRWLLLGACLSAACAGSRSQSEAPETEVVEGAKTSFRAGVRHMKAGADAYDQAVRAFRKALASAPDLWEAHLNIGIIELRRANLSAAAEALRSSIEIHPSAAGMQTLGEVYLRQGRAQRAVDLYERALTKAPEDLQLRNRLAVALRHAERLDAAEAELRAVLGHDADNIEAHATLAACEIDRGNLDLAELVLTKGLARAPEDPRLLTNMGLVHLARGDDQAAFQRFDQASKADPTFLTGRLNQAAVYLGAGDHEHARKHLEYILGVEPGNTQALLGLGVAQRMAGDYEAAEASWNRILAIDPQHAPAHFNLAVLEMDFRDHPAEAREHLERYLQLVPEDHPKAAAARERLQLAQALENGP